MSASPVVPRPSPPPSLDDLREVWLKLTGWADLAEYDLRQAADVPDRWQAAERDEADRRVITAFRYVALHVEALPALLAAREDAERLDGLQSWTKGDVGICPPGNHGGPGDQWLVYFEDEARFDRHGRWTDHEGFGANIREAIDAARGAARATDPTGASNG